MENYNSIQDMENNQIEARTYLRRLGMGNLEKLLSDIDRIEDDQEFIETENDFVRSYCVEHKFVLSEEK